jgi:hypothetical protein
MFLFSTAYYEENGQTKAKKKRRRDRDNKMTKWSNKEEMREKQKEWMKRRIEVWAGVLRGSDSRQFWGIRQPTVLRGSDSRQFWGIRQPTVLRGQTADSSEGIRQPTVLRGSDSRQFWGDQTADSSEGSDSRQFPTTVFVLTWQVAAPPVRSRELRYNAH